MGREVHARRHRRLFLQVVGVDDWLQQPRIDGFQSACSRLDEGKTILVCLAILHFLGRVNEAPDHAAASFDSLVIKDYLAEHHGLFVHVLHRSFEVLRKDVQMLSVGVAHLEDTVLQGVVEVTQFGIDLMKFAPLQLLNFGVTAWEIGIDVTQLCEVSRCLLEVQLNFFYSLKSPGYFWLLFVQFLALSEAWMYLLKELMQLNFGV